MSVLLFICLSLCVSDYFSHFYFLSLILCLDFPPFCDITVTVLAVKTSTIPAWDQTLAGRVRDGMTLQGTYIYI